MPIYMKIDGIDGDVKSKGFEKWFDIHSFSMGVETSGRAIFHKVNFTMSARKGTANIFLNLCQSVKIGKIQIFEVSTNSSGQYVPAVQLTFETVLFTRQDITCTTGELPILDVDFIASKDTIKIPALIAGTPTDEVHFWDISQNRGG